MVLVGLRGTGAASAATWRFNEALHAMSVRPVLKDLVARYLAEVRRCHGSLPRQAYDPDWPSPCQVGEPGADGDILWRPVERDDATGFDGLEAALEVVVHPDIKAYYETYWCDTFQARFEGDGLSLIQVWNRDDFDRLIANLLGHAMAKRRARQALTLFFAMTDESEYFLSVDNTSGRVLLEAPGAPPTREVAPSLERFLARVEPMVC